MAASAVGRYQILRKLATGGMAEIFLARQQGLEGLERTVVIKRILQHRARDAEFVTMFLDEARIVATLTHPNVAQIYELGKEEDAYFLVMEYVRGPDVGKILDTIYEDGGRGMPLRIALPILIGVCEALHYIHEKRDDNGSPLGIVHRDINPQNVVVSYEGAVKLIDFGIAKAKSKVYETRTGVIKGTYGYMAPEQLTRKAPIDRRSDVFAMGVLLYETILGVHPFEASDEVSLLGHIVRGDFRRPRAVRSDFPEELERVVLGCLAPRPEQRIPDARTVQLHLEEFMAANHLVVSMARLGDFVRDVVPESASKPHTGQGMVVGAARPLDGPTPPNLNFPVAEDSVLSKLAGTPPPDSGEDVPLFPLEDDDATSFLSGTSALSFGSGSARLPSEPKRFQGMPALDGSLSPAPLLAAAPTQALTHRSGDSEEEETVLGKHDPLSQTADISPASNLQQLGNPPARRSKTRLWRSATARGIGLVTLAAAGGALMAALGVSIFSPSGNHESVAVADSAPIPPSATPRVQARIEQPIASASPVVPLAQPVPVLPAGDASILPVPMAAPLVSPDASAAAPAPSQKSLLVESSPRGARIWIDGVANDATTPATIELDVEVGQYVLVRVALEGYEPREREVEVVTGRTVFELERNPRRPRKRAIRPRRRR